MSATSIIKESLKYPNFHRKNWGIMGAIFLILAILNLISYYVSGASNVVSVVSFLLDIFILGFGMSLIASTIQGVDDVPEFSIVDNFVDGIKGMILYFVYSIIPFILTIIVAVLTGLLSNLFKVAIVLNNSTAFHAAASATTSDEVFNQLSIAFSAVPVNVQAALINSLLITICIAFVLYLIVLLFANMGLARMVETGSLKAGLSIGAIFKKISSIGWGTYISWFILTILVTILLGIISYLISFIPILGMLLKALIITSFGFFFNYRTIGLIYNEG